MCLDTLNQFDFPSYVVSKKIILCAKSNENICCINANYYNHPGQVTFTYILLLQSNQCSNQVSIPEMQESCSAYFHGSMTRRAEKKLLTISGIFIDDEAR